MALEVQGSAEGEMESADIAGARKRMTASGPIYDHSVCALRPQKRFQDEYRGVHFAREA